MLEELPLFIDKVNEAIVLILACFIKQQSDLHHSLSILLAQAHCVTGAINSQAILTDAMNLLQDVSNDLGKLSVVPATLGVAFYHRGSKPSPPLVKTIKRDRPLSMPLTQHPAALYEEIPHTLAIVSYTQCGQFTMLCVLYYTIIYDVIKSDY